MHQSQSLIYSSSRFGLGEKTIFYELRKHILTTRLKEDLLTAAIEEAYTDSW